MSGKQIFFCVLLYVVLILVAFFVVRCMRDRKKEQLEASVRQEVRKYRDLKVMRFDCSKNVHLNKIKITLLGDISESAFRESRAYSDLRFGEVHYLYSLNSGDAWRLRILSILPDPWDVDFFGHLGVKVIYPYAIGYCGLCPPLISEGKAVIYNVLNELLEQENAEFDEMTILDRKNDVLDDIHRKVGGDYFEWVYSDAGYFNQDLRWRYGDWIVYVALEDASESLRMSTLGDHLLRSYWIIFLWICGFLTMIFGFLLGRTIYIMRKENKEHVETLKDKLLRLCNPKEFMRPYDAEKVYLSSVLYDKILAVHSDDVAALKAIRKEASLSLGISFIDKKMLRELLEEANPKKYTRHYDSAKFKLANDLYKRLLSDDVTMDDLEEIQEEIKRNLVSDCGSEIGNTSDV